MKRLLGLILSIVLLSSYLVGCSKTPTGTDKDDSQKTSSSGTSNDTKEATWPRTFIDSKGIEVKIEKKPEKVATLMYFFPEILIALDEMACASTDWEYLSSLSYFKDIKGVSSVEELGDKMSPNLEKLLESEPDLIIGTSQHDGIYDSLTEIAPVVILDYQEIFADWRVGIRTIGEIIGKENEAEIAIEKILSKISNGRDSLKFMEGESVAIISTWDAKTFYPQGEGDPVYTYAFDKEVGLGLTPDKATEKLASKGDTTTIEGLAEIEADHIFIVCDDPKSLSYMDDNSVWNSLKAVKNGNIHYLDRSAVIGGPLATVYGVESMVESLKK